ncbi:phytanoyl-CoA dioxygenase family protein [Paenibacillus sp. CC-CFT747]|nr:phytanoyl-CoA dioxygenase family protein [Paenibacillus sp. CC-CFT747]
MITKGKPFSQAEYAEQGFCGPVQGLSLEEADSAYQQFFTTLGQSRFEPKPADMNLSAWHHRYAWAYELATHPGIVAAMKHLLGDNLVLWAMHFWYKEPGNERFIPWHQDINYWPMEPAINATAWVTLGFSIKENGCLKLIPGTHRSLVEHVAVGDARSTFGQGLSSEQVDESKAIEMEMSPGQIVFFNEAIFHGSGDNHSNIPRVAFSVRYTTPEVRFKLDEWGGDTERIKTFLVSGRDDYQYNNSIRGTVPER